MVPSTVTVYIWNTLHSKCIWARNTSSNVCAMEALQFQEQC